MTDDRTEPRWRTFLVEHYWPDVTADAFAAAVESVRRAAEELGASGEPVRYRHSTLVPEDAAAFCVLSAPDRSLVERVYARAAVSFDRIVDAVETDEHHPD